MLTACTSTLEPLAVPLAQTRPQIAICAAAAPTPPPVISTIYTNVSARDRLQWTVCALHEKAQANLAQAQRWENRTEWRDLPLLGAAATVAGLLLFGERNSSNALKPGEQDAIAGIGFGAAAFATFANYLSPVQARTLLRQGARGHLCMATEGELILTSWDYVARDQARRNLAYHVGQLSAELQDESQFGKPAEAKAIRDAAIKAIATYDTQIQQLATAPIVLNETAWNFGVDLLTRSDRGEQKVDQLVKAITDQTASVTKFSQVETVAANPVPKAVVESYLAGTKGLVGGKDALTLAVASETSALLDGLVNIEALVLGFDKCATTALAGGTPKADRIQRVTL